MNKELCTTTDFADELRKAARWFTEQNIDDMMRYCAELGSVRHEWILDTAWSIYDEDPPAGFDLLKSACDAAHRHGMRFDVIFKPFEGALGGGRKAPPGLPVPPEVPTLEEKNGIVGNVRPFVARHPEMRLQRDPSDAADPGGEVKEIRLVGHGSDESGIKAEDLSLLTCCRDREPEFEEYRGPMKRRETIEYRPLLPYQDRSCRVLTLGGLELPEETDCFLIRCDSKSETFDFINEKNHLVELVDEDGNVIPSALAANRVDVELLMERLLMHAELGISRYLSHPDVKRVLRDGDKISSLCEQMNRFRTDSPSPDSYHTRVCGGSRLVVMRGKPLHVTGALNPVYPEVREHWLEHVRFCVDRGVDGVNIRTGNHNRPSDPWCYGFNAPTRERMDNEGNVAEAERINGEAYTVFLKDAADMLHSAGKELGVHVHATMIQPDNRKGMWWPADPVPRNIQWQWRKWIRELADYVEFRGAFMLRPENVARAADRIGLEARQAGKPFIYQSSRSRGVVSFDGPYDHLAREIDHIRRHPDISAYNLYETANFSRLNEEGHFEGSPCMEGLIQNKWRKYS